MLVDVTKNPSWTMLECWLEEALEESAREDPIQRRDNPRVAWGMFVEILNNSRAGHRVAGAA